MSRSGYSYDIDNWALIRWRGAVASAIRGKRGQAFLKELLQALEALPEKKLIAEELVFDGQVCALGAIGKKRQLDMSDISPNDKETIANIFNIPYALVAEIAFENDEGSEYRHDTPEQRYMRMYHWVKDQIIK